MAGEIVKLAFDWKFYSFVYDAAERIIKDKWDPSIHKEMIANQVEVYHILAQTKIESLLDSKIEPAFEEFILINEDLGLEEEYSEEDKQKWKQVKKDVVDFHIKSLGLAS